MSQSPRVCPNCGTPVSAGQRFCNNCGTDMERSQAQQPYAQAPLPQYGQQPYGQQPMQPYQQAPQKSSPIAEAFGALGLLFLMRRYRPGYRPARQSSGCCGCLVFLFIVLLFLGIPGYVYYKANPNFVHQIQNQFNNVNSNNNGGVPATQPPITTANIGQTVTYAGVDVTIVSVEQSTAFKDDNNTTNNTATNGMIRVNIKEANNSGSDANYFYGDIAHLILPDKTSVQIANEMDSSSPAKSITRDNWLDFAVPTSDKINQLTLVLGTNSEAQISIPLTGKADLSAFQSKTATLNIPINYGGVNWTLKTATSSLSIGGNQAGTGMHYVVLTFNLDNPTSSTVYTSFASDYMRLQSGNAKNSPTDSKLPDATANTSGLSGTVTFLMPDNGNAYTLILLAIPSGIDPHSNIQVNTDFKI